MKFNLHSLTALAAFVSLFFSYGVEAHPPKRAAAASDDATQERARAASMRMPSLEEMGEFLERHAPLAIAAELSEMTLGRERLGLREGPAGLAYLRCHLDAARRLTQIKNLTPKDIAAYEPFLQRVAGLVERATINFLGYGGTQSILRDHIRAHQEHVGPFLLWAQAHIYTPVFQKLRRSGFLDSQAGSGLLYCQVNDEAPVDPDTAVITYMRDEADRYWCAPAAGYFFNKLSLYSFPPYWPSNIEAQTAFVWGKKSFLKTAGVYLTLPDPQRPTWVRLQLFKGEEGGSKVHPIQAEFTSESLERDEEARTLLRDGGLFLEFPEHIGVLLQLAFSERNQDLLSLILSHTSLGDASLVAGVENTSSSLERPPVASETISPPPTGVAPLTVEEEERGDIETGGKVAEEYIRRQMIEEEAAAFIRRQQEEIRDRVTAGQVPGIRKQGRVRTQKQRGRHAKRQPRSVPASGQQDVLDLRERAREHAERIVEERLGAGQQVRFRLLSAVLGDLARGSRWSMRGSHMVAHASGRPPVAVTRPHSSSEVSRNRAVDIVSELIRARHIGSSVDATSASPRERRKVSQSPKRAGGEPGSATD